MLKTEGEIPFPRSGGRCFVFENFGYFFGGHTSNDGIYFSDFHRLNLLKLVWFYKKNYKQKSKGQYIKKLITKGKN